jgi:xanthine dehydrogenase small subunit
MMPSRPIRFFHRGELVSLTGSPPDRTVLEWLREDAGCHGTKEGCAEGDCGACVVIVAALDPLVGVSPEQNRKRSDGLTLRTVNACLQLLPMLDGKAIYTIEDLSQACSPHKHSHSGLHPVQEAMVACHGSQCGFCTPGFVMSLTAMYEDHHEAGTQPARRDIADGLAGNLCRCTGYRPIIEAGVQSFLAPNHRLETAATVDALQSLAADPALQYCGPSRSGVPGSQRFFAPRTVDELAALREQMPQATLLAGATDIGLWVTKQFRDLGDILFLGAVRELQRIERGDTVLTIGAGVSLEAAWAALVEEWPELREVWLRFAGPPVRHSGTMGGNLANGSPIGDSAPILMALDAQLILRKGLRIRTLPLDQFYLGYRKNQLETGEFLQAIQVPRREPETLLRAWKVSKRYDCDISAVCGAFALRLEEDRIVHARFAFGGMAAIVKRASQAESAVLGRPWTRPTADAAADALGEDFAPLSDLRASQAYRMGVAGALFQRLWLQTRSDAPLSAEESSVWAVLSAP